MYAPRQDPRIGFVAQGDPMNPRTFSGTALRALQALRSTGRDIVPINSEATTRWELREARLHRLVSGRPADWLTLAKIFAQSRRIQQQLRTRPVDLLVTTGTTHLAFVKTRIPVVVWNDAVFPSLVDYYESFTGLAGSYRAIGRWADSSVTRRAYHCAYSSDWAANEAKRHYGLQPERVSTITFGPGLEKVPARASALTPPPSSRPLKFLFVGLEWERKGGPKAVKLVETLRQQGVRATLSTVGCIPPEAVRLLPFVESHGFLAKAKPDEAQKLDTLFRESHFLVVPSQAECCAQVYIEATAYGLPVIASQTGGTATAVRHGETGYLVDPRKLDVTEVADWAREQISIPARYETCRQKARDLYDSSLNWKRSAEQMNGILDEALRAQ